MNWGHAKLLVALVMGIAIGAGATWALVGARGPQVEIIEGHTTNVNEAGTTIGVATEPDGPGKGYGIAGAFWREAGGAWNTSGPTYLEPLTSGQQVRMAVVQVEPEEGPGREIVVWLECLD